MSARVTKFAPLGAVAAAVFMSAAPQTASALPFELDFSSTGESVSYALNGGTSTGSLAGPFTMTNSGSASLPEPLSDGFLAWCFDLTGTIENDVSYELDTFLSPAELNRVTKVFDAGYQNVLDASSSIVSAGFQVAVWEAIYDGLDSDGLGDGVFEVTSAANTIQNSAIQFLDDAAAGIADRTWTITQINAQSEDRQDLGTATAIPLPAAAWLLLGVSGALVAAKRRSARKSA